MKLINHKEDISIIKMGLVLDQIDLDRELKTTTDELRLIEERFYKVFDLNPCPMSIADIKTRSIMDVNDAFLNIIGLKDKHEIIGKHTTEDGLDIIRRKDEEIILKEIRKNGELRNYMCSFKNKSGKKLKGIFSGSIIMFNDKDCLLMICQVINNKCLLKAFKTYFLF